MPLLFLVFFVPFFWPSLGRWIGKAQSPHPSHTTGQSLLPRLSTASPSWSTTQTNRLAVDSLWSLYSCFALLYWLSILQHSNAKNRSRTLFHTQRAVHYAVWCNRHHGQSDSRWIWERHIWHVGYGLQGTSWAWSCQPVETYHGRLIDQSKWLFLIWGIIKEYQRPLRDKNLFYFSTYFERWDPSWPGSSWDFLSIRE